MLTKQNTQKYATQTRKHKQQKKNKKPQTIFLKNNKTHVCDKKIYSVLKLRFFLKQFWVFVWLFFQKYFLLICNIR